MVNRLLRRAARGAAVALALGVLLLAGATDASAHAYLVRTDPGNGDVLKTSPRQVALVFDEGVSTTSGALAVYDGAGRRVDSGLVVRPAGDSMAVRIARRLRDGTYTVAWRVTSADTHVVHGAFTFSVGKPSATGGAAAKLLANQVTPTSVSLPFTAIRFANFLLILACGGGALAIVLVVRDALPEVRRRLYRLLVVGGAALALAAGAGLPLQAAEQSGTTLGGGFGAAALAGVRDVRFGQVWLTRTWLALLLALVALSLEHWPNRGRLPRELALVGIGLALVVTPSAAGHASIEGWLTFLADAAHVAAAAVWAGGLAFLAVALASFPARRRWPFAARSVPRFSTLAVGAMALLLVAGVVNAYLEVRGWRGLWSSTYGQLVIVKAGLVLAVLGLGAFNNRISVPRLRAQIESRGARRAFVRAIAAELALVVVIVGVTAVLVNEPPAKAVLAQRPAAFQTTTTVGPFAADVSVTPAAPGPNRVRLSLTTRSNEPARPAEVRVAASLPSQGIGPLRLTPRRVRAGEYEVAAAPFTIPGSWRLELTVRRGEFDEWLRTLTVPIGKG
jgi:copper transport protein